jgi:NAD(P)H-hydrate epimerase
MKIFPAETVKKIDSYTIRHEPIASIDLMERAAMRLTDRFVRHYKINRRVLVFAGPGNNGGDALAMARLLSLRQYKVMVCLVASPGKLSEDCHENLKRLEETGKVPVTWVQSEKDFPAIPAGDVLVDGLFGSGLTRRVEGVYRALIRHLNASGNAIVSIDIPSGLFGEDNTRNDPESIIRARQTYTFQFPFLSFFFAENRSFTGSGHVLDIGLNEEIIDNTPAGYRVIDRKSVADMLPERNKFDHKGNYGHALAIAGSYGMMGAALLTGEAALRSGAGLVTLHVPGCGNSIVQTAFPEAIVSTDIHDRCFSVPPVMEQYSAIAAGPGLGKSEESHLGLKALLERSSQPLLLDADALNIIGSDPSLLSMVPENTILTPHPREFDRIAGTSDDAWSRHHKQISFSKKYKLIIVLKGAFTGISFPDGSYWFNMTGNPGMATGGSGDVLTGIILSLLAQGVAPGNAAIAGVYVHGLAGDLAAAALGQEAMIAGDIIKQLGKAFMTVHDTPFLHEGRTGGIFQ